MLKHTGERPFACSVEGCGELVLCAGVFDVGAALLIVLSYHYLRGLRLFELTSLYYRVCVCVCVCVCVFVCEQTYD